MKRNVKDEYFEVFYFQCVSFFALISTTNGQLTTGALIYHQYIQGGPKRTIFKSA